jgi:hypothetical protein
MAQRYNVSKTLGSSSERLSRVHAMRDYSRSAGQLQLPGCKFMEELGCLRGYH